MTERLWPTLLEPLRTREQARGSVLATAIPRRPRRGGPWSTSRSAHAITDAMRNDLVRGVVATDALIGTFARLDDPSLLQNVCFLYHLIGGGVGDWHVPVGGMGAVSAALAAAASAHGAEIVTGAEVYAIDPDGEVRYRQRRRRARGPRPIRVGRRHARRRWPACSANPRRRPAPGAQVKVNMVLRRLPRLRDDTVTPEQAFGGTFHVNETWSQLDAAYSRAAGRCAAGSTSVRDLLPFADRPQHPVAGAARIRRAHVDGVRSAHAAPGVRRPSATRSPRPCWRR